MEKSCILAAIAKKRCRPDALRNTHDVAEWKLFLKEQISIAVEVTRLKLKGLKA